MSAIVERNAAAVGTASATGEAQGGEAFCYARDPRDVRHNGLFAVGFILLGGALALSIGLNIYVLMRRPDVLTVVKKGDEVVAVLDNRSYGGTDDVKMSPGPGDEDLRLRMYAAEEMARLYYSFDRKTWEADKDKLVMLMMPDLAYGWARDMKESREYQRRLAENWQATWTVQDKRFDDKDPYLVRIIGTQEVTKGQDGRTEKMVRQFSMEIKLFGDEAGPQPRNLNTGYRPSWFSEKELPVRSKGA